MAVLRRTLTVAVALDVVADYLSDLTTSVEWDPYTVRCRRVDGTDDGPVAVGARYEHMRAFRGYEVAIEMTVVEFAEHDRVVWQGRNTFASGREELRFTRGDDGATVIEHEVEVTLQGVARFGNPMLSSVMTRIADDGTPTMEAALARLGDQRGTR